MKANTMRLSTLALCMAMLPATGWTQFISGPSGSSSLSKPWSSFKLNKTKKVKLMFKNAGVDSVLGFFMDQTGINIIHDPTFKDPITLMSATPVTLDRAFDILKATIGLRNFDIVNQNDMLLIRPKDQGRGADLGGLLGGQGGGSPFGGPGGQDNNVILTTYPIKFANASEVARVINDIFASSPTQNNPFNFFNRNFQGGGPGGRGNRGGGAMVIGPGGINFGGGNNGQQSGVKASSDDYSNTVIVNANAHDQEQVRQIIQKIDKQTDTPIQPKVFKLQYANANDIAPVVQNVLTVNAPKGRGGQGNQQQNFGAQFGLALARGGAAAFGNVVPDTRTNSLVVSTTLENLALVDQVIRDLDKPTAYADTTFIFPLQNAKADQVVPLLQGAFGTRTGAAGSGQQQNGNARPTPQTPNVSRTSPGTAGSTGGGARPGAENVGGAQDQYALSEDQKNLLLALQDPTKTEGELLTSVAVAQGGFGGGGGRGGGAFFGQFGGGQNQSSTAGQLQLGPDGKLVNTRDLTGQVTFIYDINTNSIIAVGPPGIKPILQSILDQLDKTPQQVMIDVMIVEANLTKQTNFGLEWKAAQLRLFGDPSKSGVASQTFGVQNQTPAPQGFNYALTGNDLSGFFNMLQTDTKFDVLSSPKIFTTNGIQATINISQSIPYVLSTIQDAATGSISYNYAFENVGIVLTVTPRITAGNVVQLDIDQQANDLQGYTSFNAPIVNQREATTEVQVEDGKTVVLGGMIRSSVSTTVNKLPILGDLPILGNLFRSSSKNTQKTELLIFLSP
ncbi:MAG TPA: secretin N-terminal domain-containing protein, partial [Fimbriimonadaceae bacterium]|nr:secretin N-terminal domain-containing protein [Fimbriimonadaceae bacterium]